MYNNFSSTYKQILVDDLNCQISSGADVLCHYSLMIFHRARLPLLSPNQLACLQHAAFVLGYAASAPAMARMRRKKQFVLSAVLMGVSLGVLAACLILKEVQY